MVLAAFFTGILAAGEAEEGPDDGGECFLEVGTGDFLPPTPVERGGDGDVRPVRGGSFCRLLEGTGEDDLTAEGMRFGGMVANHFLWQHRVLGRPFFVSREAKLVTASC